MLIKTHVTHLTERCVSLKLEKPKYKLSIYTRLDWNIQTYVRATKMMTKTHVTLEIKEKKKLYVT